MILFFILKLGAISMGDMRCSNSCIISSFDGQYGTVRLCGCHHREHDGDIPSTHFIVSAFTRFSMR